MELSKTMNILIDAGMWIAYALVGVAILVLMVFAVRQIVDNPGRSKVTLIGLVSIIIVLALAYILSSGTDLLPMVLEKAGVTESTSRWIGAGLIATYLCFGGAIVSLITVEVMRPFKK